MFAKLSAVGHTREEALGRLKRALAESAIAIKGGTTNRTFLLQMLDRDEVRASRLDVGWLDRDQPVRPTVPGDHAGIALLQAADRGLRRGVRRSELEEFFSRPLRRCVPPCRSEAGRQVEVGYLGHRYQFKVYPPGHAGIPRGSGGDAASTSTSSGSGPCERWMTHGDHRYRVLSLVEGYDHLVEVEGVPHRISRADSGNRPGARPGGGRLDLREGRATA